MKDIIDFIREDSNLNPEFRKAVCGKRSFTFCVTECSYGRITVDACDEESACTLAEQCYFDGNTIWYNIDHSLEVETDYQEPVLKEV